MSNVQQQSLCAPFNEEDLKCALFDNHNNKAACPDGYSSGFFKQTWGYVGNEVTTAVFDFSS